MIDLPQLKSLTIREREPASFDSYGFFTDVYNHPGNYLNGTAPLNVTGCINSCVYALNESTSATGDCTVAEGSAQDSFMWYVDLSLLTLVCLRGSFIRALGTMSSTFPSRRRECLHVKFLPS